MHARGPAVAIMPPLRPDAELLPKAVERAVLPLLEQIGFVIRVMADRRMARLPRHPGEPIPQIFRRQGRMQHRIGLRLRRDQRVVERPRRLLQLERAELADSTGPAIAEAAAIHDLTDKAGRVQATQRSLGVRRVAEPHRADAPVTPGLGDQPGAGIEPILAVGQVFDEPALRPVAATAILVNGRIAAVGQPLRHHPARQRGRVGGAQLAAAGFIPAIGRPLHHHRKRPGRLQAGRHPWRGARHPAW